MRSLNISNEKKRDAVVGMDNTPRKSKINYVLKDGSPKKTVKILKGLLEISEEYLVEKYGDLVKLGEEIIKGDPEIDMERTGRFVSGTKKLYIGKDNKIVYRVNLVEVVKNPDGTEKLRRDLSKTEANILGEIPLQWTGKKFPKEQAIRKFVFTRKYQIKHVNGLTYDYLYDMAKSLHESNSLMFVGGGKKGIDPVVLTTGGVPYRGFLEGRIDGDKYCLILHLTNMELKGV
ncbi:MAG TPA: hypothetical protein PK566_00600 [Pseudobacteroides sp.]|nr:hypothetical protein [Pseudobacteroides sp.]